MQRAFGTTTPVAHDSSESDEDILFPSHVADPRPQPNGSFYGSTSSAVSLRTPAPPKKSRGRRPVGGGRPPQALGRPSMPD